MDRNRLYLRIGVTLFLVALLGFVIAVIGEAMDTLGIAKIGFVIAAVSVVLGLLLTAVRIFVTAPGALTLGIRSVPEIVRKVDLTIRSRRKL